MSIESVGIIALVLTLSLQIPTVYYTWRNRCVENQEWKYLSVYSVTCLLWMIYGYEINAVPIGVTATMSLVFCMFIVGLKYKYGNSNITATV